MKKYLLMIFMVLTLAAVPFTQSYADEVEYTEEELTANPRLYAEILEPDISDEDLHNLALLVLGEAEGESAEGKRWVIDTVLNRVDSKKFPNDISDVIYQKKGGYLQFSGMSDSRQNKVSKKIDTDLYDEVVRLIKEELLQRTNYEVLYFRNKHYHNFGTPVKQVGNHYFSK